MIIFKKVADIQNYISIQKEKGKSVGFVPTMGALHEGHISLIEFGKTQSDFLICSIFVNPTQFNDKNDFEKYPITIDADIELLEKNHCDVLFLPSVAEMYPDGMELKTHYDLGNIENLLEGAFRPGHFQGVCQVVERLLRIVLPDKLFMGQKDYQQVMVLKKMIQLQNLDTELIMLPIKRSQAGLALSSRNARLNQENLDHALTIIRVLEKIKSNISKNTFETLKKDAEDTLLNNGFEKIDYIELAQQEDLQSLPIWIKDTPSIILIAAWIEGVRLIDNILID
ncbi:pantoate--beta-alanine ligase [Rhizosphaericola mali]|uniref:Pantothenate synthetase n=1 Tax=Rhizosphaericola mali TaxID=2545455 RepID=A0A5P2G258_9BACT|nr:pantoate--beta-alanine ligase [Rhizosphaericola mali]QES87912.1 pantoate--beta-alanine ligase [Rhizosphaericola mali]